MVTRIPSRKSSTPPAVAELLAGLRRDIDSAAAEQVRQVITAIARDRAAIRSSIALAEIRAGKVEYEIQAGDLFFAASPAGQTDFVAIRDEVIPTVTIVESGPVAGSGTMASGWAGYRLLLNKLGSGPWPDRLRFHLVSADSAAALYQALFLSGACAARPVDGEWRKLEMLPTAAENAENLFPAPSLGCRGRSLLAAWFHAPFALACFDVAGLAGIGADAESVELMFVVRAHAAFAGLPEGAFRVGCVPLANRRTETVHVTLEASTAFTPLPVPAGQAVSGVGRVQLFRGQGEWAECRPWLGTRYPWRHKIAVSGRYALTRTNGLTPPAIGLIDPGADLSAADAHQFHVELFLADTQAHTLPSGTAVTGNSGLQAEMVAAPSPLLIPAEVDPAELEAETTASGWLSRDRGGDATDALRAMLERAAGGLTTARGGRPAGLASARSQIDGLLRATTRTGPVIGDFPGTEVEIELDAGRYPDRAPYLFATVLERALSFFARPLTYTRLTVRTEGGVMSWSPRLPAARSRFGERSPSARTGSS
jgi:hypothetical protein